MEPLLPPFRRRLAATLLPLGGVLRFSLGVIVAEFVSDMAAWLTLTTLVSTLLQQNIQRKEKKKGKLKTRQSNQSNQSNN